MLDDEDNWERFCYLVGPFLIVLVILLTLYGIDRYLIP